jgi:hypothetical protein
MIKKIFSTPIVWILAFILLIWLITLNAGPKNKHIDYGATFSEPYAKSLGLDWKQLYLAALDDLNLKNLRLSAYWDEVEQQKDKYDFTDLDFQVNQASQRNVNIVLAVGRRLPRWPECHDPNWIGGLSQADEQAAQLSYVETVVNRYQNNPHITVWQVENEPFLGTFGICPKLDTDFLDKEIALVKKLDPTRPVLITDSGELDSWLNAGSRGDIFGTTFYRYVFSDVFKRYWTNPIPAWFYRLKAGYLRLFHPGKQVVIIELEAEPWTTNGITSTPINEQFKTMSLDHFNTITSVAAGTGFSPQYLWGVEWWYWVKQQGHPEFWEAAKKLINN